MDLSKLVRIAKKQRWTVDRRKGGHIVWVSPKGEKVFSGSSLSDHRALHNVISELRKRGLEVPR